MFVSLPLGDYSYQPNGLASHRIGSKTRKRNEVIGRDSFEKYKATASFLVALTEGIYSNQSYIYIVDRPIIYYGSHQEVGPWVDPESVGSMG